MGPRRDQTLALGHGPELDAVSGNCPGKDHHTPIREAPERLAVGNELLDDDLRAGGERHRSHEPTGVDGLWFTVVRTRATLVPSSPARKSGRLAQGLAAAGV